jgi:hypothetical protein
MESNYPVRYEKDTDSNEYTHVYVGDRPRRSYWPALLLVPLILLVSLIGYGIVKHSSIFDDSGIRSAQGPTLEFGVGGGPPLILSPTPEGDDTRLFNGTDSASISPVPHDVF